MCTPFWVGCRVGRQPVIPWSAGNEASCQSMGTILDYFRLKLNKAEINFGLLRVKMKKIFLLPLIFLLASCRISGTETTSTDLPEPLVESEDPIHTEPTPGSADAQEEIAYDLSFIPAVFRMEEIGFELQYPQDWMLDEGVLGSRAFGASFTSWQHPAGQIDQVPDGETILSITVYQWDPKNDLDAYVQTRMRDAWTASGIQILTEEEIALGGDHRAVVFTVRSEADLEEAFFLATLAGDEYLVLSGSGDLELLKEIAFTSKFIN